eukprot:1158893-Pelagomonas_calceolata.AAC.26
MQQPDSIHCTTATCLDSRIHLYLGLLQGPPGFHLKQEPHCTCTKVTRQIRLVHSPVSGAPTGPSRLSPQTRACPPARAKKSTPDLRSRSTQFSIQNAK